MFAVLNSTKTRATVLQIGYVGGIVVLILACVLIARANLQANGMTSGFDFLFKSTGWKISFSLIEYQASDPYWKVLLIGVINTLFLGSIGLTLATVIGILIGICRTSENDLARLLGAIYVETFRNIPLIVQVFFWYTLATRFPGPREALNLADSILVSSRGIYFPGLNVTGLSAFLAIVMLIVTFGILTWITASRRFRGLDRAPRRNLRLAVLGGGLVLAVIILFLGRIPETALISLPALQGLNIRDGIRVSPELMAMAVAIAIYGGAYIAEIVRGGFQSVGRGQIEAGKSIGLSPLQVFTQIRFPLALRAMLPILTNQYIWLIKATTLGIAVGFTDFFMVVSISINQSGQTIELIGILMAGFLIINFTLAAILNRINKAIALKGNQLRG